MQEMTRDCPSCGEVTVTQWAASEGNHTPAEIASGRAIICRQGNASARQ